MASPVDVSALAALANKREELMLSGHMARAAEYAARELAGAHALGVEDCLIEAQSQLLQVEQALTGDAVAALSAARARQARTAAVSAFCDVVAALRRRQAAGTLMPGSCHPCEVEWSRLKTHQLTDCAQGSTAPPPSSVAEDALARFSQFIGYDGVITK